MPSDGWERGEGAPQAPEAPASRPSHGADALAPAESTAVAQVLSTSPEVEERPTLALSPNAPLPPTNGHVRAAEVPAADVPAADVPAVEFAPAPPPALAQGVELIGEFADSGFKKPPFIARRADRQIVQMPEMLFRLAEQIDGRRGYPELAERFTHAVERQVAAEDVRMLVEQQLRPLGIVAPEAGEHVELGKVDPLLALKFRAALVPDTVVRSLTTLFKPLFLPPVVIAVVAAMLGLDGWLFLVHGISQSLRGVLYQPALMLMLIAGVILATAFHEIGHATACRYGGARPGVMGVGIYIVWPAFYTDITDAYRLARTGRLRADLGGMYFNSIFALVAGAAYFATGFAPLLLLVVLQTFAIIQQALPLLRLDGYYILSDLTGVPDIFTRIRPVLLSLLPGREADPRVAELKRWVRFVVSGYVLMVVAFLGLSIVGMVINLPRVIATGYDSAALHWNAISPDLARGRTAKGILDVVETLFLVLPAAGLAYTAVRMSRRGGGAAWRWSSGHPARRTAVVVAAVAAVALAVLSWWPNGEYRPIQPGERGTLSGLFHEIGALPTARPSLTSQRAAELHGAPGLASQHHKAPGSGQTGRGGGGSRGSALPGGNALSPGSRRQAPASPSSTGTGGGATTGTSGPGTSAPGSATTPSGGSATTPSGGSATSPSTGASGTPATSSSGTSGSPPAGTSGSAAGTSGSAANGASGSAANGSSGSAASPSNGGAADQGSTTTSTTP